MVRIVDGPLGVWSPADPAGPGAALPRGEAGAVLVFEGVARGREPEGAGTGGRHREIEALDYQAYQPMAERMVERIARDLVERHALLAMLVEHSRGRVGVGERSFRLVIWSAHRKEGLAAADEFIDRLKRDVPIWKRPVWRA
jgi:molybdopterin synthase catalytic subunit